MIGTVFLAAVVMLAPLPPDTIVDLRRGDRVVIGNMSGDLTVETWNRDALEVVDEDGDAPLRVERSGNRVTVIREGRRRRSVEARLRVPDWVDVEIGGPELDVFVRGVGGELVVGNISGDIRIRDVTGPVDAKSIDGDIQIDDARAGVRASSQSDDVILRRIVGRVEVHSGSGDVLLQDVESSYVRAETQDGDISFSGSIEDGGEYAFYVHDGDAVIAIPEGSNARVNISTYDGEFDSEFPVLVQRFTGGREFEFALGDGTARVHIEVFDGEIHLLRRR